MSEVNLFLKPITPSIDTFTFIVDTKVTASNTGGDGSRSENV